MSKLLQVELYELVLHELLCDCPHACSFAGVCCITFTTVVHEHWIWSGWLAARTRFAETIHTTRPSSS